jgi:hypothetical protein
MTSLAAGATAGAATWCFFPQDTKVKTAQNATKGGIIIVAGQIIVIIEGLSKTQ